MLQYRIWPVMSCHALRVLAAWRMKNALTLNGAAVQNCWTMYIKYDPAHSYYSLIKNNDIINLDSTGKFSCQPPR